MNKRLTPEEAEAEIARVSGRLDARGVKYEPLVIEAATECPSCALLRAEVADLTRQLATSAPADGWSYCPYCGIVAPRPGLHRGECPGQEMQRTACRRPLPLPTEKP